MENLQLKKQLRTSLQNTVAELMTNYDIPATDMEDALSYVLLQIKDAAMNEYVAWSIQDKATAMQNLLTPTEDVKESSKEE